MEIFKCMNVFTQVLSRMNVLLVQICSHEPAIVRLMSGFTKKKNKYVTHLDETSHMSAEFVFRYGPKCMGGLILPILVLLHLYLLKYVNYHMAKYHT